MYHTIHTIYQCITFLQPLRNFKYVKCGSLPLKEISITLQWITQLINFVHQWVCHKLSQCRVWCAFLKYLRAQCACSMSVHWFVDDELSILYFVSKLRYRSKCNLKKHVLTFNRWTPETSFKYAGCLAILSGIPDAEGWHTGCHFWRKLDSDAMHWKVKMILEQKVEIHQLIF